ncbi:SH3 domain-containing protein [Streptomyces sp. NPDC001388]|uniref:SH3 domain-containing protein n=1 Tax=unclassified Streptomyces TaxID=2593676 RepID=UPI0036CAC6BD
MSLRRSALTRLALATAVGALVTAAAVTPATADDDWNGGGTGSGTGSGSWDQGGQGGDGGQGGNGNAGQWNQGGGQGGDGGGNEWSQGGGQGGDGGGQWNQGGHNGTQRLYRGRVTANRLLLRSKPTRASQVIRSVHRGQIVSIFCKTPGQNVQGNPLWYLLTDGTWAWGAARYIDNIGEAPRWC